MLVNVFISSRVDYCNTVFVHSAAIHLCLFESVLNAVAKLIMRRQKYDHITPAMRDELHWLRIQQCMEYKVCRFVYKYLNQMAPSYVIKMCIAVDSVESCHHLWSAAHGDLILPRTKSKLFSPWRVTVAASSVWNSLSMRTSDPL